MTNNEYVRLEIEGRKREHQEHGKSIMKHYVRVKGWVACARKRLRSIRNKEKKGRHIRYFTLCGRNAMDVLLLEKHDLLFFDGRGFPDVVFCEQDSDIFENIRRVLKRVRGDFKGSFESIVSQSKFIELFPFDIFNLDFTRNCFPNWEQPFSSTLNSIVKIIEEQGNNGSGFDLFVTFRAERSKENEDAVAELKKNMEKNLSEVATFKKEFVKKYGDKGLDSLLKEDYSRFLLITFPKLVVRFGNENNFAVNCSHEYQYSRKYTCWTTGRRLHYTIIKFIFSFKYVPVSRSIAYEVSHMKALEERKCWNQITSTKSIILSR